MSVLFTVLVVLVIGAIAVVASGRGAAMAEEYDDRPDVRLPDEGPLHGEDLRRVRFTTALRGYRASEVDALLVRLARELDAAGGPVPEAPLDPGTTQHSPYETPPPLP